MRFPSQRAFSILAVSVIAVCIFTPMLIAWQASGDFVPHGVYIQRLLNGDATVYLEVPNFLYHILVAIPAKLLPSIPLTTISVVVCVGLYGLLAIAILWSLPQFSKTSHALFMIAVTSALLIVAPLTLLTPNNAYFGYFHPYVYHNPTMIPLRLFSWVLFMVAVQIFEGYRSFNLWRILWAAALTIGSILSKPSFMLILLPTLGLYTLLQLFRRRPFDAWTLILGIGVPAIGLLGFQALTYPGGSIAWEPLLTFNLWAYHYNPLANTLLALKLVMSLLFPLCVVVLDWQGALNSTALKLAWIGMLGGLALSFLLYDTGEPPAGNLVWSGQIAVFILMIASTIHAIRYSQKPRDWRTIILWLTFGVHVVGGIVWYIMSITAQYPDIVYKVW